MRINGKVEPADGLVSESRRAFWWFTSFAEQDEQAFAVGEDHESSRVVTAVPPREFGKPIVRGASRNQPGNAFAVRRFVSDQPYLQLEMEH